MKKYIVKNKNTQEICGKFDSMVEATEEMMDFIENHNEDLDEDDENYLTPFDFTCEIMESKDVNECITTFEEARKALGGKPNADFTVAKKILSGNSVNLADISKLVDEINPAHIKALYALNQLFTIAQAWNKEDDFVPDYSNSNQDKWYPWFVYRKEAAGFVSAITSNSPSSTGASLGSRLCFKTSARARQFGEQFIDLWNDVLLFR